MAEKYPLAAVRDLRAREEDDAKEHLARAIAAHEQAIGAVRVAEQARLDHGRVTEAQIQNDRARDRAARGVSDMNLLHTYTARRKEEARVLDDAIAAAKREADARAAEVETSRGALAHARAEREAVERHFSAWQAEQRKVQEARAEAEIEDVAQGRRTR